VNKDYIVTVNKYKDKKHIYTLYAVIGNKQTYLQGDKEESCRMTKHIANKTAKYFEDGKYAKDDKDIVVKVEKWTDE